jgi:hypothetical protein
MMIDMYEASMELKYLTSTFIKLSSYKQTPTTLANWPARKNVLDNPQENDGDSELAAQETVSGSQEKLQPFKKVMDMMRYLPY